MRRLAQAVIDRLGARREECCFWGTYAGAELDLLVVRGSLRLGIEFNTSEVPQPARKRLSRTLDVRSKTSSKFPTPSTFTTPWSWLYFSMTGTVFVSCSWSR